MNTLSIKEISLLYFPNSTPKSAASQFKRWLRYNKKLWAELAEAGYWNGQRLLTPRQVEIVFQYLGEPGE